MDFPFIEEQIDDYNFIRTFPKDVDEMDLIWHADKENRIITVLEGNGWKFQFDEELPIKMRKGKTISILKGRLHRVIKGNGDLTVKGTTTTIKSNEVDISDLAIRVASNISDIQDLSGLLDDGAGLIVGDTSTNLKLASILYKFSNLNIIIF